MNKLPISVIVLQLRTEFYFFGRLLTFPNLFMGDRALAHHGGPIHHVVSHFPPLYASMLCIRTALPFFNFCLFSHIPFEAKPLAYFIRVSLCPVATVP